MILRRLAEHVKAQNWTAVYLDFAIVVLGVFMGLQVQEWNMARKDRIEATHVLGRLEDDFVRISEGIDRSILGHRASLAATADFITALAAGQVEEANILETLNLVTSGRTPPGPSTTFQELKSNGRIGLIDNLELRRQLSRYDEYASLVRQEYRVFQEPVAALSHKLMAFRTLDVTGEPSASFDALGATRSVNTTMLINDPDILAKLQIVYLTHDNAHLVYEGLQDQANEILRLIRAEMAAAK